MLKFRKNKNGFTLVELLVVVIILGVLASIALPRFVTARAESGRQACRGNLVAMQNMIEETLLQQTNLLPGGVDDFGTGGIIAARFPSGTTPVCPADPAATTATSYDVTNGTVTCKFGHII